MRLPKKYISASVFVIAVIVFSLSYIKGKTVTDNPINAKTVENTILDDSINPDWLNWSWGINLNFTNEKYITGSTSATGDLAGWGGIYLNKINPITVSDYKYLTFKILTPEQIKLNLLFYNDQKILLQDKTINLETTPYQIRGEWKEYTIDLSTLNLGTSIHGFAFQNSSSETKKIFIDSIALVSIIPDTENITSAIFNPNIYTETLSPDWKNWSWGTNINFSQKGESFEGDSYINFESSAPWAGLYFHSKTSSDVKHLSALNFAVKTNDPRTKYQVALYTKDGQSAQGFVPLDLFTQLSLDSWKEVSIPLSKLNPNNIEINGIVIQDMSGRGGHSLYIDKIQFVSSNNNVSTLSTDNLITSNDEKLNTSTPVPLIQSIDPQNSIGFTASQNNIYKNGQKITLKGINWFGFETETYVPHGLWVRNWQDMIAQIKNLGFNAVRVPVCPKTLGGASTTSVNYSLNQNLKGLNSLETLDRFMNEFNSNHIYVLLDHHRPDCNAISQLWYTDSYREADWINDLKFMAQRYKGIEYFMGIDIKNEPHGSATWGAGNPNTDWNKAAEKASKAILSVNPNILLFVQGIQENPNCSSNIGHWMGGNLEPIHCTPLDESYIPKNKLVLSPHVYGPDVYNQGYFYDTSFPSNMVSIWEKHFGFLVDRGYTIVPGEWGGKYGTGDPKDKILQDALVNYFKSKRICNSFYWDLNPNSSDTGGILKDNWNDVWEDKMTLLREYFNNCN